MKNIIKVINLLEKLIKNISKDWSILDKNELKYYMISGSIFFRTNWTCYINSFISDSRFAFFICELCDNGFYDSYNIFRSHCL